MVKFSELTTAEEIHERDMADPAYRAEHERAQFAKRSTSISAGSSYERALDADRTVRPARRLRRPAWRALDSGRKRMLARP